MDRKVPLPPKRPGLKKLNVVQAQKPFKSDDISFEEGDLVYILSSGPKENEYKCRVGQCEGIVPGDILEDASSLDYPLHEAAKRGRKLIEGNISWLKELVVTGISVNTLDMAGNSALYWACRSGHLDCVKVLLAAHPVINQQNKLGDTILHGAAWGGHADILSLLMQVSAVQDILQMKNTSNKTAYELAKNVECAAILQQYIEPIGYASVSSVDKLHDNDGEDSD